jgi:hypothetical protein
MGGHHVSNAELGRHLEPALDRIDRQPLAGVAAGATKLKMGNAATALVGCTFVEGPLKGGGNAGIVRVKSCALGGFNDLSM